MQGYLRHFLLYYVVTKHEVASVLVLKNVCPSLLYDTLVDRYKKIIGFCSTRGNSRKAKNMWCATRTERGANARPVTCSCDPQALPPLHNRELPPRTSKVKPNSLGCESPRKDFRYLYSVYLLIFMHYLLRMGRTSGMSMIDVLMQNRSLSSFSSLLFR